MPAAERNFDTPSTDVAPARRTQAERVAESDTRMLQAAMRLVASRGYAQTTLEAIGLEAGYSRGLVSHRFGSKDKMLEELVNRVIEDFRAGLLQRLRGLSGLDALFCEIDCYLEGMDDPPLASRVFFVLMHESIGPAPQIREHFVRFGKRWQASLTRTVCKGQQAGSIRNDVSAAEEARLLIATLRGLRTQSMLDPAGSHIARDIAALKSALQQRLSPTPPALP
ncbi:MAG: TetR/AcrR family transcriptional regulator [Rhizobacter sp.]